MRNDNVYCCKETPPKSVYPLFLLSLLVTFFGNSIDWMTTSDRLRGDFVKSGYSALEATWPDSWCCQVTFTHKSQQCRMKTINPSKHTTLKDLSSTLSYFLVTWDSDSSYIIRFAILLPYWTLEKIKGAWSYLE